MPLAFKSFRSETSTWEFVGSFAQELSFGNFNLGSVSSVSSVLSLGIFRFGTRAYELAEPLSVR